MVHPAAPHQAKAEGGLNMASKKNSAPDTISEILTVTQGFLDCYIVGMSPLVMNRLSEKAKHELLLPSGRKNAVTRATVLKHQPVEEFRASPHRLKDPAAPAYLAMPATAFKGVLCTAALDMPGMKKAQIGRLAWVPGDYVAIFGVPKLFMCPVRSADMNRTPDIRTRAILPQWGCRLRIAHALPLIRPQALVNLLAAGGLTVGIGDGRPEKGKLNFGQFRVADDKDAEFLSVAAAGGRAAQVQAMETPICWDDESAELLEWFDDELQRRQLKGVA